MSAGLLSVLFGAVRETEAIIIVPSAPQATSPAERKFQEGTAALERNDLQTAEAAFNESIKLDGKAAGPYMGLAQVALRRNQKQVAEANMKKAVELAPDSAAIQTSWGTYLYTQRDLPAAEEALRKAVALDSNTMAAHLHLGDMYLVAFHKPDEAIAEYRAAVAAQPSHAGAHYALGLALLTKGDASGEAEVRQAIRFGPQNPLPHHLLGRWYASQKQLQNALKEFDAALKLTPAFPAPYFERGQIFAAMGDDDRALVEYAEFQKRDPKQAVGLLSIGVVHQRQRRWSEAESSYLSAIKIEPKNAIAYNNLAWMAADRKTNLARGLEWAKKAVSLAPNAPEFQVTLAWVYRAQGNFTKAEQTLRAAAALKPQRASAAYYLGRVYLDQGKKTEAVSEFRKALMLQPDYTEARQSLKELGQS